MISARKPLSIDLDRMELRRGFIDVHTPRQHLNELLLTFDEQVSLIRSWIKELEDDRSALRDKIGRPGKRGAKNLNYEVNTNPKARRNVRTHRSPEDIARDRFISSGKEIQILQRLLSTIKSDQHADRSEQS